MALVRSADRGDAARVARSGQPVMHRRPNSPSLNRRLTRPLVTGDQQNDPLATTDRALQRMVNRRPSAVEVHSVQIEDPVGLYRAAAQLLVPATVQRLIGDRNRFGNTRR